MSFIPRAGAQVLYRRLDPERCGSYPGLCVRREHGVHKSAPKYGPGTTRSFSSFSAAVAEIDDARVFGAVHFRMPRVRGNALGQSVAEYVPAMHCVLWMTKLGRSGGPARPGGSLTKPLPARITSTNLASQPFAHVRAQLCSPFTMLNHCGESTKRSCASLSTFAREYVSGKYWPWSHNGSRSE